MTTLADYTLEPDLTSGVLPISAAVSRLARLLKAAHEGRRVFVLTQQGRPTAVILDIELYTLLARQAGVEVDATPAAEAAEAQ